MISFFLKTVSIAFLIIVCSSDIFAQQDTTKRERLVEVKYEDAEITSSNEDNKTYNYVEQMPTFPGGTDSMYRFIWTHIQYPAAARESSISGNVIVQFVVDKEGLLQNIRVMRGVHPSLDAEAIRVVRLMNEKLRWKPGKHNNKVVPVNFNLPIKFSLE